MKLILLQLKKTGFYLCSFREVPAKNDKHKICLSKFRKVDCVEGKFKVKMLLAYQKQNVKRASVAFHLTLAKCGRDSGVVSSDG